MLRVNYRSGGKPYQAWCKAAIRCESEVPELGKKVVSKPTQKDANGSNAVYKSAPWKMADAFRCGVTVVKSRHAMLRLISLKTCSRPFLEKRIELKKRTRRKL